MNYLLISHYNKVPNKQSRYLLESMVLLRVGKFISDFSMITWERRTELIREKLQ